MSVIILIVSSPSFLLQACRFIGPLSRMQPGQVFNDSRMEGMVKLDPGCSKRSPPDGTADAFEALRLEDDVLAHS